jgi:CheY-like chemotaxis protein
MLKNLGLTFDIAEDGQQAVTKVINSPQYDLVLMDIQMPVMDGYEATEALRKQGKNELIICGLSANAMKEDYLRAEDVGMNDYLTKPLRQLSLEKMLSKYLNTKSEKASTVSTV